MKMLRPVLVAALMIPAAAIGSSGGAPDYSGKSGSTCGSCHQGGTSVPTVSLTGPTTLSAGTSGTYTLTISGGPAVKAGWGVAVDRGTLAAITTTGYVYQNELLHKAPVSFNGAPVSVQFSLTAPATTGALKIFAAGNSVNGTGGTGGDRDAATTLSVNVTAGNAAPTLAAAATANPATVTAKTTTLSVLGADDGGEANLTYTWSATGPAPVTFSANGTNAAKSTTATFARAGSYTFTVRVADAQGSSVTGTRAVSVSAAVAAISLTPATAQVATGQSRQFAAAAVDQFGTAMSPTFAWSVSGGGTISTSGLLTAGATAGGPHTVTAAAGGKSGTASVTVVSASAPTLATAPSASPAPVTGETATLSVLGADDGGEANLLYTWSSSSGPAPVTFSVNGTNAAKSTTATFTRAGTYVLQISVKDAVNLTTTATVNVTVSAALTAVSVSPAAITVPLNGGQAFSAQGRDQFGALLNPQPAFTWSSSGGGTISTAGAFSAGSAAGGPHTITASAAGKSGTASVTVAAGSPPTVITAAAAAQSPVTGASVELSVAADDDEGEAALSYDWRMLSGPAPVTFSGNGSNGAKRALATFSRAGSYGLQVLITDAGGLSTTSSVNVVVDQTFSNLSVAPASATVVPEAQRQFTATAEDQFGRPLSPQPAVSFSVVGGGAVSPTGLYTAPASTGGPYSLIAASGGRTGIAQVTVAAAVPPTLSRPATAEPALVAGKSTQLSVLASDSAGESSLRYRWEALTGPAAVTFSVNDSNLAKATLARFARAGAYALKVTVTNPAGLSVTSEVAITVTQTLTTVRVSPAAVTVRTLGAQAFTASAEDQFGEALTLPSAPAWTVSSGGTISADGKFVAQGTPGGPFLVTASAGSLVGTGTVVVSDSNDHEPPALTVTGVEKDQSVRELVEISADVRDSSPVDALAIIVDDQVVAMINAPPFRWALDTRALEDGPHRLSVMARDDAGNAARTAPMAFFVDNSAPTVDWVSPATGATVDGRLFTKVEVSDNLAAESVRILLDDVELATVGPDSSWEATVDVSQFGNGSHWVDAIARDAAGNEMTARVKIELENTLPEAVGGSFGCAAGGSGPALFAVLAMLVVLARRQRGTVRIER